MDYSATIEYLMTQLPMFQRIGAAAYKKDLLNILELCEAIGNPHVKFPSLHIGGTNGKGTTAHALAAILQAHGYKTGLYISPHYMDFRERIKIDGEYIDPTAVINFTSRIRPLIETLHPSFFEITVAMAFDYFAQQKVDIAIIEVGLGGRLDSTNIISPLLSVITNISYDHTQMLGDTLEAIAAEKAGIIKPYTPVVIGEYQPETMPVFAEKARLCHAPLYYADQHYETRDAVHHERGICADIYLDGELLYAKLATDLHGDYQLRNLCTVLQATALLSKVTDVAIEEPKLRYALANISPLTKLMGRWQFLRTQPPIAIADSAHNEAGLQYAMNQLVAMPHNKLHLVVGMVRDKDISKMLALLPPSAMYYFCCPNVPRGLEADRLAEQAATHGLFGEVYNSVLEAYTAAIQQAQKDDIVYVGGSTFVVAEVLHLA